MSNNPGLYSIQDIINFLKAFCAAIIAIAGAIGVIVKWVNKAKEPTTKLTSRVDEHDKRLNEHDDRFETINGYLANDKKSIEAIKEGNRVTQSALLAIMGLMISSDENLDTLIKAKDDLNAYLINK